VVIGCSFPSFGRRTTFVPVRRMVPQVAGPSASDVPASTCVPALTMTRCERHVPWLDRSNLWIGYHCSGEPSSGFSRMPSSRLKLSSLAAAEDDRVRGVVKWREPGGRFSAAAIDADGERS